MVMVVARVLTARAPRLRAASAVVYILTLYSRYCWMVVT